jgi:hypothetical protein
MQKSADFDSNDNKKEVAIATKFSVIYQFDNRIIIQMLELMAITITITYLIKTQQISKFQAPMVQMSINLR